MLFQLGLKLVGEEMGVGEEEEVKLVSKEGEVDKKNKENKSMSRAFNAI